MAIKYKTGSNLNSEEFKDILVRSTLGQRRPVDDDQTISGMAENSNLIVTAWDDELLVGIARSMTDFHYACYLSDLAVDETYQRQGIGKELLRLTSAELRPTCTLILIAAPDANEYYPKLGFVQNERTWTLPRGAKIGS